jgi:RNA polymerase sigma factor (sigma-70 family)
LNDCVTEPTTQEAIEAVWRLESTRLIAGLVRMVRDVGLAEDLAQDALVAALSQWPRTGVPDNPGAWLMRIAKRRGVDQFRRRDRRDQLYAAIAHGQGSDVSDEDFLAAVDHVEDDVLRLMFVCCHPVLTPEAQCTLTLKLVGGLTTREIARAYLTTEATVAQRVVRAKRTLTDAGAALEEPSKAERAERLTAVLSVIYLLNRAVALGMAYGPEAGLALLDQVQGLPVLSGYHLLPSVRGDLLDKLGRREEARTEFARAATMTQNERERALPLQRARGGPSQPCTP